MELLSQFAGFESEVELKYGECGEYFRCRAKLLALNGLIGKVKWSKRALAQFDQDEKDEVVETSFNRAVRLMKVRSRRICSDLDRYSTKHLREGGSSNNGEFIERRRARRRKLKQLIFRERHGWMEAPTRIPG